MLKWLSTAQLLVGASSLLSRTYPKCRLCSACSVASQPIAVWFAFTAPLGTVLQTITHPSSMVVRVKWGHEWPSLGIKNIRAFVINNEDGIAKFHRPWGSLPFCVSPVSLWFFPSPCCALSVLWAVSFSWACLPCSSQLSTLLWEDAKLRRKIFCFGGHLWPLNV